MKKGTIALVAAVFCCISCIDMNYRVGSSLIPGIQNYTLYTVSIPIPEVEMRMADSLSGYSSTRITIGALRDEEYGLGTRSCILTLVPLVQDSINIGDNPVFKSFHFAAAKDTVSFRDPNQERIFQTFNVYELSEPVNPSVNYDCNLSVTHSGTRVNKSSILYTGDDSLSFNFTEEFGTKFLSLTTEDIADMDTYLQKFPGIYFECEEPAGLGGRINIFDLQLGYNSDYAYLEGNYAQLNYSAEFDGERIDTTLLFYYGATDFYDLDSLFSYSGTGSFPQYSLNLTSHETRDRAGLATDKIYVEGGGGLKPVVSGAQLKTLAENAILEVGGNPETAVINRATVVLPFEFPDDYTDMDFWPQILSPTCRLISDTIATFMGLTDTSDENEDQGDINRSTLRYSPDITYHVQSLIRIDEDDDNNSATQMFKQGMYDVWFLIMANETTVTTTSGSSELSELYSYLAFQSYYNDLYGYGSSYSSYYSNYYSYALLASLYGSSTQTESVTVELDKDRYYYGVLLGPESSDPPMLKLTFGIPIEEIEE